ncbi:HTH domain-containing protein [Salinivibrio kushneri]|uniref:HTH domain-containing protein n=1 Tax=Salinivibrio kushneri TaxID=1908198 RepID=UPI00098945D2|nr:HTH domain-containing protein [Salinivibrio kushneri]OOE47455.1 hypothetical protein BZG10_12915 [Salinivibrio kushneri]
MSSAHNARLTLIDRLSDGEFHSGEMLGDALGMSRAAISKHIKVLQSWGLDIYRVQGKGYCLSQPIELLDDVWLREHTDVPALSAIPVIDSTNQYLMERVGQLVSGSVCLAEYQQQGRGRRGRAWQSPFGSNLYWARLAEACHPMPSRNTLAATLIARLKDALIDYEQHGLSSIMADWPKLDNFIDRPVKLLMGDREVRGIERGIDEHGALLLDVEGDITPYLGGEISLRRDD